MTVNIVESNRYPFLSCVSVKEWDDLKLCHKEHVVKGCEVKGDSPLINKGEGLRFGPAPHRGYRSDPNRNT